MVTAEGLLPCRKITNRYIEQVRFAVDTLGKLSLTYGDVVIR